MIYEALKITAIFLVCWVSFATALYMFHRRRVKKEFEELINGSTKVCEIVYPKESVRDDLARNRLVYDRRTKKWIRLREID